jgi:membrane protein DedA with SNARE-associated domain
MDLSDIIIIIVTLFLGLIVIPSIAFLLGYHLSNEAFRQRERLRQEFEREERREFEHK